MLTVMHIMQDVIESLTLDSGLLSWLGLAPACCMMTTYSDSELNEVVSRTEVYCLLVFVSLFKRGSV